jgi:mono/diheme cytochrome c family protein
VAGKEKADMNMSKMILVFAVVFLWSGTVAVIRAKASEKEGKKLYQKECVICHGENGDGKGSAAYLLSPKPRDFTREILKFRSNVSSSFPTEEDLFKVITDGIQSSSMPGFSHLSEMERRSIVQYIQNFIPAFRVKRIQGSLPQNPLDQEWENIPFTRIPLLLLWQSEEGVDAITMRALYNEQEIAIYLEWEDENPDVRFLQSKEFVDAVAIQFSLSSDPPHYSMGEKGKPVNIWYWRADRQEQHAEGLSMKDDKGLEKTYPDMVVDGYPYSDDPLFYPGVGAGNLTSSPITVVEDLNSEGFSTLTPQGAENQNVHGQGSWENGQWKVVFTRSLKSKGSSDVVFKTGEEVSVAFAVWNGSNEDRDGQKSVTPWYILKIEK